MKGAKLLRHSYCVRSGLAHDGITRRPKASSFFARYLVLTAGGIGGASANRLLPTAVVQINTEVKEGCHHKDTEGGRSNRR